MPKFEAARRFASMAGKLVEDGSSAVGKAGQSVMHGEVSAAPSLIDNLNSMRSVLAPIDAGKKAAAAEQAQQAFISRVGNMRGMLEDAHKAQNNQAVVARAKQGIRAGNSYPTKLQVYESTHSVPVYYRGSLPSGEEVRSVFGGPLSTKEVIEHNTGGWSAETRANRKQDAIAAFSSKNADKEMAAAQESRTRKDAAARVNNAKSLPLGATSSTVWDEAMKTAEGGTIGDLETAYRKLDTNNRVVSNIDASKAARTNSGFGKFAQEERAANESATAVESFNNAGGMGIYSPATGVGNAWEGGSLKQARGMGTYHADPVPRPTAQPAFSVADSPVANTKLEGFGGGAGSASAEAASVQPGPIQKIMLDAQKAAKEGKQVGETPAAPKSGEPVSQDAGFGGGAGATKGPMDDFFKAKLNAKELSNADRYKLERVRDDYQNYMAEIGEANGNQEEIAKVRDKYGIKGQSGPVDHFTAKANEDATTMDWMMGNHVPQYAAGSLMLGGAVAACFSNKGQMSNSELYGQNF